MKQERYEIQAGIFVFVGIIILAAVIFFLGQERRVFASKQSYHMYFKDVKGLSRGAPVRLGGITVGQVSNIHFTESLDDPRIKVTLRLVEGSLDRIRSNSFASLNTQGLLGDQYVSIEPGTDGDTIAPGNEIPTKEGGNITETISEAADIIDSVRKTADTLNEAVTEFRKVTLVNINSATENIAEISKEVKNGDGFLHGLIYPQEGEGDDQITKILNRVDAILNEVESGKGILHALVYSDDGQDTVATVKKAVSQVGITADTVSTVLADVKNGKGLLHSLIYKDSPDGLNTIMNKISKTADNLEKASHAIASGSGTLGALLIDPALYENLVEVTDGAKRSFLLRQVIRSSLNR